MILIFLGIQGKISAQNFFKEPALHNTLVQIVGATYEQKYQEAEELLKKKIPKASPCYKYFLGLIYISKFNDLGDSSKFWQAEKQWQSLKADLEKAKPLKKPLPNHEIPTEYYLGLTEVQLSYTAKVKGNLWESAMLAKSGIKHLRRYPKFAETTCVIAIYDFYKGLILKYIDWLPFVSADYTTSMETLKKNYNKSSYLEAVFLTSLIWMQFDLGRYESGFKLTQKFLSRYPENRVYLGMEADFLYKLKQTQTAAEKFEALKEAYQIWYQKNGASKNLKINYYCAVGNLVRVYRSLGNSKLKKVNSDIWFSKEVQSIKKWLPKSLVEDLENYRPG